MLFNSVLFIVGFLPISLVIYFLSAKISQRCALFSLIALSLVFYGWHTPLNLLLIGFSLTVNYLLLCHIAQNNSKSGLITGILFNLGILCYFKYSNFLVGNINSLCGAHFQVQQIALPLAISFFTFQKIALLVDTYRKEVLVPEFPNFCAFVLFFPQLIAGPILRHREFLPQLNSPSIYRPIASNIAIGSTLFILGLFKKAVLADTFSGISDLVFNFSQGGGIPSCRESWLGVLAFSLQIYFDFSGYSDMAIGLARMFNFKFPMNFNSPYKSTSIIEFWRRWHISLSFLLRDYLYIPLGGNQKGSIRRYANLLITMLIGGLWHGASWTFVIWGGLHGTYLVTNHLIRKLCGVPRSPKFRFLSLVRHIKRLGTFLLISITWVFFRAENFHSAKLILLGLIPTNGKPSEIQALNNDFHSCLLYLFCGLVICFGLPNTYEWLIKYRPVLKNQELWETKSFFYSKNRLWRPSLLHCAVILLLLFIAFGNMEHAKEFIYFQF